MEEEKGDKGREIKKERDGWKSKMLIYICLGIGNKVLCLLLKGFQEE